jgi:hypothetical protein
MIGVGAVAFFEAQVAAGVNRGVDDHIQEHVGVDME